MIHSGAEFGLRVIHSVCDHLNFGYQIDRTYEQSDEWLANPNDLDANSFFHGI